MWRAIGTHVAGTSHAKLNIPCQDYCAYQRAVIGSAPGFVIAIADGAGSARLSQLGSRAAVDHLLHEIPLRFSSIFEADEHSLRNLLQRTRDHLESVAVSESAELGDVACTILFAILSEYASVFVQIGDGAWVAEKDGQYFAPTWPSGGEYANETTFLTSPDWDTAINFNIILGGVSAVAGFTDGLQRLALELNSRSVHVPFFEPFFRVLRATEDETTLIPPLIEFLSSDRVVERTDDDKTLVIACRQEPLLLTDVS